jgi:hypothetical protein
VLCIAYAGCIVRHSIACLEEIKIVKEQSPLLPTNGFSDATGEVRRVLACRDYFAVLEISDRTWLSIHAADEKVPRQFKKKSLMVRARESRRSCDMIPAAALSGDAADCRRSK